MIKKPIFSYNSGNDLHIQHLQLNSLNINAKLVMVEVALPHFHPTPEMSRRFLKTSSCFALNTTMFFLNAVIFLKKMTVFKKDKFMQ